VRRLLETRSQWMVCGEAATGEQTVSSAAALAPDVAIVDFSMPGLHGLEVIRQLRRRAPQTAVVVLTVHRSDQLAAEAIAAGARGYVLKDDAGDVLISAIEQVAESAALPAGPAPPVPPAPSASPDSPAERVERPTPRELQILQLIAEGRSSKEVAQFLCISVKTAETHRTNLMRKLDIHSVSELVRYAIRHGIIQP